MVLPRTGAGSKTPKAPIRVSQATIDKIKRMGMTKALAGSRGANPEMKEGLRRMYGTTRVKAAVKAATPPNFKPTTGKNKKPEGRLSKSTQTMKTKTNTSSKGMSGSTKAKLIGAGVLVAGAATKVIPAGRALSGVVGLGKAVAGAVGRKKVVSATAMAGMKAAKAGKDVTAGQYKAMQAAAKAAKPAKKLVKTKRAAGVAGVASMVPKPKSKKTTSTTLKYNPYTREKIN